MDMSASGRDWVLLSVRVIVFVFDRLGKTFVMAVLVVSVWLFVGVQIMNVFWMFFWYGSILRSGGLCRFRHRHVRRLEGTIDGFRCNLA